MTGIEQLHKSILENLGTIYTPLFCQRCHPSRQWILILDVCSHSAIADALPSKSCNGMVPVYGLSIAPKGAFEEHPPRIVV